MEVMVSFPGCFESAVPGCMLVWAPEASVMVAALGQTRAVHPVLSNHVEGKNFYEGRLGVLVIWDLRILS